MGLFIWNMLSKFERAIMVATSVVIVVLVMIQVILRYVFKHPIMGVEEMATLLGFWMYFIGAANGSRERSHIRADLLNVLVKDSRRLVFIKSIVSLFTLTMVALMTNWTWNYVTWSIKTYERSPSLGIPMIYSQVALFVAALLMLLYTLVEFMDYFLQLIGKKPIQISFDTDSEKEIN
ncbi:MAG TPA: TRAP transporter small permease [Bacteroidales bacterium]|nr:TRAP-type transport system small permease protein [Synergistales bacterium]HAL64908.1 TRAP transporter small permease [Bacteroidales bacterium]